MHQRYTRFVFPTIVGVISLLLLLPGWLSILNANFSGTALAQSNSFSGALNTCDPVYNRLFSTSVLSVTGSAVFYEYQVFTVSVTGVYTLSMSATTIIDAHASIYQNSFNPAAPLSNALYVDDDSGPGVNPAFLDVSLVQDVTYILVTSTLTNGMTGAYTWSLSGDGTFMLGDNNITLTCPTLTPSNTHTFTPTPAPPVSFSGQLDTCDPTYNRLFNTNILSVTGSAVFYETHNFSVAISGTYTITMNAASIIDAHASIYQNSFNPAAPLSNVLAVDDDSGPGVNPAFLSLNLMQGVTYIVVTSTLTNGMTGTYTWSLSGDGQVLLGDSSITLGCGAPTATLTPLPTDTPTATLTPLPTDTLTATLTPLPTDTLTATLTPLPTDTPTATYTATSTSEASATFTATFTTAETSTADPQATLTPSATLGASQTPTLPPPPACPYPLVTGAVQGRMISSTIALWEPNAGSTTDVIIPVGSSWWIIDVAPGFYRLWIACEAQPVWVSAFLMTPNYDSVWQGQPLPGS
ncbi:hypothetical protein FBR02_09060 [Anaerolineae bacterium CFX9]|nr:hypothetical protein [Anaerolineae bacterium CFX9]